MEVSADQLQQAVESQHGGKAVLVFVEPVKEVWQGKTVWGGHGARVRPGGPSQGTRAYAWSHLVGDAGERRRFFAVLHLGGIRSPLDAVRAAIVAERRNHP